MQDPMAGGITTTRLYDELKLWFAENGLTVPSQQAVAKSLKQRGYLKKRTYSGPDYDNSQRFRYIGLDIVTADERKYKGSA